MKKNFLLAAGFLAMLNLQAQNIGVNTTNPLATLHVFNPNLSGNEVLRLESNSGYPRINFMGNGAENGYISVGTYLMEINTGADRPIYFRPGGNSALMLSATGNVGIGTIVPFTKLHLTGGNYDLNTNYGDFMIGSGSYSLRFGVSIEGQPTVPGRAFILSSGAGAPGRLYLGHDGNTNLFSIDNNRVGIGMNFTTPEAKLQINSQNATATNPTLLLDDLSPVQVFRGFQSTARMGINGYTFYVETAFPSQPISFKPGGQDMLTVTQNRVGVNTPLPNTLFDVYRDLDLWHAFFGGETGRLQIAGQSGNGATIQSFNPTSGNVRDLYLQRDGGNVGVGNTSPQVRLHVSGAEQVDFLSGSTPHLLLSQADAGYARLGFRNTNGRSWTIAGVRTASAATDQLNFFNEQAGADRFVFYGNGNATFAGTLTQNSDERLKTHIQPVKNVLAQLYGLNAYTYRWKDESRGNEEQIGFLAQEVEKIYPQLVRTDENGYKSVAYQNLVPVLLQAIKEQNEKMNKLEQEMEKLKSSIAR